MNQADPCTANRTRLRQFIEAETEMLLGTLRCYVLRAGLADGPAVALAAVELLNGVVVEALDNAERFRPDARPMAWLLGIAANLIKREQADRATRGRREPLVRDLCPDSRDAWSEDELFDRLATANGDGPGHGLETSEAVSALLACLSDGDRRLVELAVVHDLDGKALAGVLGVTPGAARVRLYRALNRLRRAWPAQERGDHG